MTHELHHHVGHGKFTAQDREALNTLFAQDNGEGYDFERSDDTNFVFYEKDGERVNKTNTDPDDFYVLLDKLPATNQLAKNAPVDAPVNMLTVVRFLHESANKQGYPLSEYEAMTLLDFVNIAAKHMYTTAIEIDSYDPDDNLDKKALCGSEEMYKIVVKEIDTVLATSIQQ